MFNIIKTLQNYFARELLCNSLSSEVALCFSISKWQPYLVVSCLEEVFLPASAAPVGLTVWCIDVACKPALEFSSPSLSTLDITYSAICIQPMLAPYGPSNTE